jgi:hypothetical protein
MGATAIAPAPPPAQRPTIGTHGHWWTPGARATATLALLAAPLGIAAAQATSSQLWGEIDGYWSPPAPLAPLRFLGTAAFTRSEEVDALELTGGLHAGVLTSWGSVRLGMNVTRSLSVNEYREDKIVAELNAAPPIATGWRFSSRTRIEQRWIFGAPSQRYRERVRLERKTVLLRRYTILPYTGFEVYYDTRYHALSRTGYRLGVELPLSSRLRLDPSAVRQDNRFGSPRHVSATAMTISLLY